MHSFIIRINDMKTKQFFDSATTNTVQWEHKHTYLGLFTESIELQNGNFSRRTEEGYEIDVERDNLQLWL